MDLERMRDRCVREQWSADDLYLDGPVAPMSREMEVAIVQTFTDMISIEQLAAALFVELAAREHDPALRCIFETFVIDELRHAEVARRLAARFNVRRLKSYGPTPALARFAESFIDAVRYLPPDIAAAYTLVGEIILDMALLRSLEDALVDPAAREAMRRINRDESRHLAVDLHMFDSYASEAYAQRVAEEAPRPARVELAGALSLCRLMLRARPFFRQVFFDPMARLDPSGRRLKEAVKRLQLLIQRPGADRRPFVRLVRALFSAYQRPIARALLGPALVRLVGIEPELLRRLYTDIELRRVVAMSMDELYDDARAAKRAA